MQQSFKGQCLCGQVKFELHAITDSVYCHCERCRKLSGAPVSAWVTLPKEYFKLSGNPPKSYKQDQYSTRFFCNSCGSQLYSEDSLHEHISVHIGSLNEPELLQPTAHICCKTRLSWLKDMNKLPESLDDSTLPPKDRISPFTNK